VDLAGGPLDLGQRIELRQKPRPELVDVRACLHQQRTHRAARGIQHGQKHVGRLDELVIAPESQRLGIGQRLLETAGEFVHAHGERAL